MQNVRLDESQTGIKVAKWYSNNLRYADDTTNGRKWRGTKAPPDEDEIQKWKSWLKAKHSKY